MQGNVESQKSVSNLIETIKADYNQRTLMDREKVQQMSMFEFFGCYYRRTKDSPWSKFITRPIVRVFPDLFFRNDSLDDNEHYFELQVKLHVPWIDDFKQNLNPNQLP